ncbi:uncharacterized protein METZ01_LOCUS8492 [marine metagenome]|uniref:Uncharacterized protein n=1 Tax=marine metagenome TaxID=408172 RepID=A0A381NP70_9ZZZZ
MGLYSNPHFFYIVGVEVAIMTWDKNICGAF